MADRRVIIPYTPRDAFLPFHARKQRWASLVVHRRGGKTVASVNDLQRAALRNDRKWPPPKYAYIAPYYNQAKRIAWGYAKHYADPIPGRAFNESELKVTYPNGAELRLFGADNPDSLRGDYFDGVVPDEYADWSPSVWPLVVRPMLTDFDGWAAFIGTPKGKNAFYRLHKEAEADPKNWFTMTLKSSVSGLIPSSELADLRKGLSPEHYEQEFECSFDAAIKGAYYAECLREAEREKRIGKVPRDPLFQLRTYWDIGGPKKTSDAMAVWLAQFVAQEIRVLGYIEGRGQPLSYYVDWMREVKSDKCECVLPHDGVHVHADNPTLKSLEDQLNEIGFKARTVPNQGAGAAMQRVQAARRLFPRVWFNEATTQAGRDALAAYAPIFSEDEREIDLGPAHDWPSHGSDAFGLMCIDYEPPRKSIKLVVPNYGVV